MGGRVVALDSSGNIVKDIGSSTSGSGGAGSSFKFTPSDSQALFAAGLNQSQVAQVQQDINTFGFDAATASLTSAQKAAVTKVAGETQRFLTPSYISTAIYSSEENKQNLKEDALDAGYGSKGFFGIGKSITDKDVNDYISQVIMPKIESYREMGLDDKAAWAAYSQ